MSDSDESSNFGALLFGDGADEVEPEYPIETLVIDRAENAQEGSTNAGFTPLYDRYSLDSALEGEDGASGVDGSVGCRIQERGLRRLAALRPAPLAVHYRNKRHSLWGHRLWNAAKYLSKRMDQRCIDVRGRTVLELGAGLGVPSLVAYRNGARVVVVTDYPDDDLIDIIRMNVEENCTAAAIDADATGDGDAASPAVAAVEPLLWGHEEHIKAAMAYTGGAGFDVVILSDILFNHVCNDDLVETLTQTLSFSPGAAGYCVFSHHRAFKQLQDFEFFDKCVAHGLVYEQVDEEAYPMMFPDDRGPEEVRMPVKCYKLTRRFDRVGGPLDTAAIFSASTDAQKARWVRPVFDAVIQGTGMAQSLLAAALARSGLKVLHCDGEAHYGGAHATMTLPQFNAYLARLRRQCDDAAVPAGEEHLYRRPHVPGTEDPHVLIDKATTATTTAVGPAPRYMIDLLPSTFMANGTLIQQLVRSDMVRTLELQHVPGFLFLERDDGGAGPAAAPLAPIAVPLTRAGVFTTTQVGLLEKRRLMKFVKDVEATLVEALHAKSASAGDSTALQREAAAAAEAEAARLFSKELESNPSLTLSDLLATKYGLSGRALDFITLKGQLDCGAHGLLRSVQLVRQLLLSVGAYGGSTPFLAPAYGASEVPQNACRTAAVWGGVYVLQRGLCRVHVDEEGQQQYAVLTNGQHVPATVIVAPEALLRPVGGGRDEGPRRAKRALPVRFAGWKAALALEERRAAGALDDGLTAAEMQGLVERGEDVQLSRVVLIATRPLFSNAMLRRVTDSTAAGGGGDDDKEEEGQPPLCVALVRVEEEEDGAATPAPVVHIVQQSAASDQVLPPSCGHVIVHFTADAAAMPQAALEAFVRSRFLHTLPPSSEAAAAMVPLSEAEEVVYLAGFTLSSTQVALDSVYGDDDDDGEAAASAPVIVDIPSATRASHSFAVAECEKLAQAAESDRRRLLGADAEAAEEEEEECEFLRLVGVPTLPRGGGLLNDGQWMDDARAAYEAVVAHVKAAPCKGGWDDSQFIFMERLPPLPQPTVSSPSA